MNRRSFLSGSILTAAGWRWNPNSSGQTRHVIFIVNGNGIRKKEYYEDARVSPNIHRLANEGFVFTEDHSDSVASHLAAFAELVEGLRDYTYLDGSWSHRIPSIMRQHRPRILLVHETGHDAGHESYEKYLAAVKASDQNVGRIFDWVKAHPYFSQHTTIVLRPEFGRDDELNSAGELHHSEGFYYAHRVARIFWGPEFRRGVDSKTIINRRDIGSTLAELLA